MSLLFIKCPNTGKSTPTGIDVPEEMDLSGFSQNSTSCPHCPEMHTWDGKDAFFEED